MTYHRTTNFITAEDYIARSKYALRKVRMVQCVRCCSWLFEYQPHCAWCRKANLPKQ